MNSEYTVVGHRGYPQLFPENSRIGLVAAAEAGVDAVELDVQMSKDGVPVVFHDQDLNRITRATGNIWDFTASQLSEISAHEPQRFGDRFFPTNISTLEEVCLALAPFTCSVFIELKEESLERFGRQQMLSSVLKVSKCLGDRRKIISFDKEVLQLVRSACHLPIGWVLREYTDSIKDQVIELNPEILAYNVAKLDKNQLLWHGNWSWFLYDITDPQQALYWHGRGVQYIETWDLAFDKRKAS